MRKRPLHPGSDRHGGDAGPAGRAAALPVRPAAAARLPAVLVALGLALAGCVSQGSTPAGTTATGGSGGSGLASMLGGWTLQLDSACREGLAFREDGRFAHGVALTVAGQSALSLAGGTYSGLTADAGALDAQLTPDGPASEPLLAYCAQWDDALRSDLSFSAVQQDTGIDPAGLAWRPVALPGGDLAWVGTDPTAMADRLALVRDGDTLHGFAPDGALASGSVLFHREPPQLETTLPLLLYSGVPVVNLPQQSFQAQIPASDVTPLWVLMSLHSAVDIDFSPLSAGNVPACNLAALAADSTPLVPNPLAALASVPVVTLNPGDPTQFPPLFSLSVTVAGQPETLYLLYLEALPTSAGTCQVNIHARPLVARLADEHVQGQMPDAFTVALHDGPAYLLGVPAGQPSRLALLPAQEPSDWAAARLLGQVLQPVAAPSDPLGLQSGDAQSVRLSVQSDSGQRSLDVFPMDSATGLGPFTSYAAPSSVPLALDGTPVAFSDATGANLHFALDAAAEVRLASQGGADTTGVLLDAQGTTLARVHGGAADGSGFRIVAFLPAGTYALQVHAATAASFAVMGDQPAGRGLADDRLDACLRQAGTADAAATDLRAADCRHAGVTSLQGIGAYAGLQVLRLDDNPVMDLAPLGDLAQLAVLSLAGTQPATLAPLVGLYRLYSLSLVRVALDANALGVLEGLGARLTWLDLDGATGLSDADLSALKAALPDTTLVAPDGTVME